MFIHTYSFFFFKEVNKKFMTWMFDQLIIICSSIAKTGIVTAHQKSISSNK